MEEEAGPEIKLEKKMMREQTRKRRRVSVGGESCVWGGKEGACFTFAVIAHPGA